MRIAFLYAGGREARWKQALAGEVPSDFFYGAVEIARNGHDVECVDAPENPRGWIAGAYNRLWNWRTPVRTRGEHFVAVGAVFDRLKHADVVVATSTPHANAFVMWTRLKRLRTPVVGIQCGMVNHPLHGARLRATRRVLSRQEIVLFADSERPETISRFQLLPERVHANPFGVDTDFWTPGPSSHDGGYLLAVGNDGRRDYRTLVEAVSGLSLRTKIVTARPLPDSLPPNVEAIRGSWHRPAVTDAELRDLYRGALAVCVPLEDSLQPSGQSVALQAMACGRPVILTRTQGLWTGGDFLEGEHVLLVPPASAVALRGKIEELVSERSLAEQIGISAREAVLRNGRMTDFASRLESVVAVAHSRVHPR